VSSRSRIRYSRRRWQYVPCAGLRNSNPCTIKCRTLSSSAGGVTLETNLHVVICPRCGLLMQNPRLALADIEALYRETVHYEVGTPDLERPGRRAVARKQIDYALGSGSLPDPSYCIAEIGCAGGLLLEMFKETGATLVGVELSEADCESVRSKGIVAVCGAWEEVDFPFNPDLVFACHVLEHTPAPDAFLTRIAQCLKPSGHVYLEVEDMRQPRVQLASVFMLEHLFYFTLHTLTGLLRRCGLEPVRIEECDDNPPGSGMDYPVVRCVAAPRVSARRLGIESDYGASREMLEHYLGSLRLCQEELLERVRSFVDRWRAAGKAFGIFGTGGHTQQLLVMLPELATEPLLKAFLDNNQALSGSSFLGAAVAHPSEAVAMGIRAILISSREFEQEMYEDLLPVQAQGVEIARIYGESV
jgi:2-polyprenyl-3-methyl-5-hydroxy-6-metoxy-1,4-benzoquinol methylase